MIPTQEMKPVLISVYTMTSCLGRGVAATRASFLSASSGLAPCTFETADLDTHVGEIGGLDAVAIPAALKRFDCRNNRASELGLAQDGFAEAVAEAAARYGADRAGVFIGTSTAGILQTELAYRRRDPQTGALPADFDYRGTHNTFSAAEFVRERLALRGPCVAVSTACSSSAKAFAAAARMLNTGLIDMAVVGGVDTLCLTTLHGFASLQLLSRAPCRPYDAERDGISIGEAAAFFLLTRDAHDGSIALLGTGESSDAHHMSAPHPDGLGARRAMEAALATAALTPDAIDYLNLHGTGTTINDAAEDTAVHGVFRDTVPVNSTKGMTGHTLGAAGAVEAAIAMLAIEERRIPDSPGTRRVDPLLHARYEATGRPGDIGCVMSNSFGFGGSNCSLVFGRLGAR